MISNHWLLQAVPTEYIFQDESFTFSKVFADNLSFDSAFLERALR